ncbi:Transcriptional regulatory protein WalR [compost metagenome]
MREKVIIVSDNDGLRIFLVQLLSDQGLVVYSCPARSQTAVALVRTHSPDLIILDMPRPPAASFDVCAEIRRFSDKPILFMDYYNDDKMKILGLNAGGDGFINTPINIELLFTQIKAHIRRYTGAFAVNRRNLLLFPGLEVDLNTRTVTAYGQEAVLSAKEFQLLALLAKNPNRVFQTETLYNLIWSENKLGDLRTVMVHIYNLRQKIEKNPHNPLYIHTVRGSGYKFNGKVVL